MVYVSIKILHSTNLGGFCGSLLMMWLPRIDGEVVCLFTGGFVL